MCARDSGATNTNEPETEDIGYDPYDDSDLDSHPYAVRTALEEEYANQRRLRTGLEHGHDDVEFSKEFVGRAGSSYEPQMFADSQGAIETIVRSNRSGDYRLTVGTCGKLAPGWVAEQYHERPMWILHCPDLSVEHIEGCSFFMGITSNPLNARSYTRANGTIGVNYLVWNLAKYDEVAAKVDNILLRSLCEADNNGSIVIAYVGRDSCTVTCATIPVGLSEFLISYENEFEKKRRPILESEKILLKESEHSISEELVGGFRSPRVCQVAVSY